MKAQDLTKIHILKGAQALKKMFTVYYEIVGESRPLSAFSPQTC